MRVKTSTVDMTKVTISGDTNDKAVGEDDIVEKIDLEEESEPPSPEKTESELREE